jgi:LysM repeat protein
VKTQSTQPLWQQFRLSSWVSLLSVEPLSSTVGTGATLPETASAETSGQRSHTVKSGDTLSRIASRYRVPLAQLFSLNGLTGKSVLQPGQTIRIDP